MPYYDWFLIEISSMDSSDILFSYNKAKKNIPILIGGWTTKDSSQSFILTHDMFDYSIWGEGEIPTLQLMNSIINNSSISIPRIFSQKNDIHKNTNNESNTYIKLGESGRYDFSDYTSKSYKIEPTATIERSRGCNWNKCKFCYLSQGYKYRIKENTVFIKEILQYIEHCKIFKFVMMDNDFIGKDIGVFVSLLNDLKKIKLDYPNFEISVVEVITYNLTSSIINLMSECGIKSCQIGLEAISQSLLQKMNKNQSVANNIFFIKHAIINNMSIVGANVIINTPDENENDIIESINNLRFFRFFIASSLFSINVIPLVVGNYSSYLKQIKADKCETDYIGDIYYQLLSNKKLQAVDKYSFFNFTLNRPNNILWDQFDKGIENYRKLKFSYKITRKKDTIIYKEYSKRRLIKCIEIDNKVTLSILGHLNHRVYDTLDDLIADINTDYNSISASNVKGSLEDLFAEGIVYYTNHYENITSIIYFGIAAKI